MTEGKEYNCLIGGVGEAVSASLFHPLVKFYKKGPIAKDDCLFCGQEATLVADLGTQERRCCSSTKCKEKAAAEVWKYLSFEAREEGFTCDEAGIRAFLVAKNKNMKEFLQSARRA